MTIPEIHNCNGPVGKSIFQNLAIRPSEFQNYGAVYIKPDGLARYVTRYKGNAILLRWVDIPLRVFLICTKSAGDIKITSEMRKMM